MKFHVTVEGKIIASFVSIHHRDNFYDMVKAEYSYGVCHKKDDQTWP